MVQATGHGATGERSRERADERAKAGAVQSLNGSDEKPCNPPDGNRPVTRIGVCITLLFLVGCTPGTDVIYGSSIRPGGGLPSITTMAVGRVGAQPAPAAPAAPQRHRLTGAASASDSPAAASPSLSQTGETL